MSDTVPRYLDTVRAAAWIGLSPKTLQRMRVTGDGPLYAKWGRRVIYDRFDLDDWVAGRKRRFTGESIDEGESAGETESTDEADPPDESEKADGAESTDESEEAGE